MSKDQSVTATYGEPSRRMIDVWTKATCEQVKRSFDVDIVAMTRSIDEKVKRDAAAKQQKDEGK